MSTNIFAQLESAVQSYARSFPCVFDRALGAEMWDTDGRRYLDFLAGAGSLNYGHNNPLLKAALVDYIQRDGVTHSLDLHTTAKEEFLLSLDEYVLQPRELDYVVQFTGPTGANAVEASLKIARKVTGRHNVIRFTNGFHGVTMGALAMTGNRYLRAAAGLPLDSASVIPYDGYFGEHVDTVSYLEKLLSDPSSGVDHPAAVIVEAVQGEGGLNAARVEWLQALQALCIQHDILLIVDDIQAGCGRTGTFFSFEAAGIVPDIVTLSKSLSGYGLPLAVVLIRRGIDIWKPGEHNGTFRGHNLAFVTANAALEQYWSSDDFSQEVQRKGAHIARRLQGMVDRFGSDLIEVRGKGMMRGICCADHERAAAVTRNAYARGLIMERSGPNDEVIKCMMPLTISDAQLNEGMDIMEEAVIQEYGATVHRPEESLDQTETAGVRSVQTT